MVVALVAGSCSLGDNSDDQVIELYVDISDAQLAIDEEMTITVTARNVGFDPVPLSGPAGCLLYIDVLDNQGTIVWTSNTNANCGTQTATETIVVGVDKVASFNWHGENLAGARMTGGFYHIRAVARLTGSLYFGPPLSVALE